MKTKQTQQIKCKQHITKEKTPNVNKPYEKKTNEM